MSENAPIPADTSQDKNTTTLSPLSEKSDHTVRRLIFASATTVGVVMVNIAYEKWASGIPDSMFILLCLIPLSLWFYWGWTHPQIKKHRHLIYTYPTMSLVIMILVGMGVGGSISTLLWLSVYKQPPQLPFPPQPLPLEIIFNPNDQANNRRFGDKCIRCEIHTFAVTIHNKSDYRIEGIRVTLARIEPSNALDFNGISLQQTYGSPADLLGYTERSQSDFALGGNDSQLIDVVYADPMHPQQSFLAHTVARIPRALPLGEHTLTISVSANGVASIKRMFRTEYDPETRLLAFWEDGNDKPTHAVKPYGGFLKPEISLLSGYSARPADKRLRAEVRWHNTGPKQLLNAYGYSQFFVRSIDGQTTRQRDHKVRSLFEDQRAPLRDEYCAGTLLGKDIEVKTHSELIKPSDRVLTRPEINGLQKGTTRIYLMSWLVWTDANGVIDAAWDCRWWQALMTKGKPKWAVGERL